VPWYARIAAKLMLSRVPAGHDLWRRLNLFSHGAMHHVDYALGVYAHHFARRPAPVGEDFVMLEIGPGDSLLSAVIGAAYGVTRTHLIDVAAFATADLTPYRSAAHLLRARGLPAPDLAEVVDLDGVLRACNASYGTQGLNSLRAIPSSSVDFVWSQAVLEHVRRQQFADFAREMRRVLRPTGRCSHVIDLKDHLGGALNNMRIPSRWWEAEWMARSGFYTNRLRRSEMTRMFEAAGFEVDEVATVRWDTLPTPTRSLAREFRSIEADELLISEFDVVLTPAAAGMRH
jgi:SAM-dependent methyltransferase